MTSPSCSSGLNTYSCPSPEKKRLSPYVPLPPMLYWRKALRPVACAALLSAGSSLMQKSLKDTLECWPVFLSTSSGPTKEGCVCSKISLMSVAPRVLYSFHQSTSFLYQLVNNFNRNLLSGVQLKEKKCESAESLSHVQLFRSVDCSLSASSVHGIF